MSKPFIRQDYWISLKGVYDLFGFNYYASAYKAYRQGRFPIPVFKEGHRLVCYRKTVEAYFEYKQYHSLEMLRTDILAAMERELPEQKTQWAIRPTAKVIKREFPDHEDLFLPQEFDVRKEFPTDLPNLKRLAERNAHEERLKAIARGPGASFDSYYRRKK